MEKAGRWAWGSEQKTRFDGGMKLHEEYFEFVTVVLCLLVRVTGKAARKLVHWAAFIDGRANLIAKGNSYGGVCGHISARSNTIPHFYLSRLTQS